MGHPAFSGFPGLRIQTWGTRPFPSVRGTRLVQEQRGLFDHHFAGKDGAGAIEFATGG